MKDLLRKYFIALTSFDHLLSSFHDNDNLYSGHIKIWNNIIKIWSTIKELKLYIVLSESISKEYNDELLCSKLKFSISELYKSIFLKGITFGRFKVNLAPTIACWTSSGIYALVNSKRKNIWSWLIINHKLDIEELLITLNIVINPKVTPTITWKIIENLLFELFDSDVEDWDDWDNWAYQYPDFKSYPKFHKCHTKLEELVQILQFFTSQFLTISLNKLKIGLETPFTKELMLKKNSVSLLTSGDEIFNSPVFESIEIQEGAIDPFTPLILKVINVLPENDQVKYGMNL